MSDTLVNDIDPIETQDWLSAVDSLIRAEEMCIRDSFYRIPNLFCYAKFHFFMLV